MKNKRLCDGGCGTTLLVNGITQQHGLRYVGGDILCQKCYSAGLEKCVDIETAAKALAKKICTHPQFVGIGIAEVTERIFVTVKFLGSEDLKFPNGWMGYEVVVQVGEIPQARGARKGE